MNPFKTIITLSVTVLCACEKPLLPVGQVCIPRIEQMPNAPTDYHLLDWSTVTRELDTYLFDFNANGNYLPIIWIDNNQRNLPIESFGLYTAIGDVRQGAKNNRGEHHESIGVLGAIFGATLNGVDKSSQDGYNFVRMCQNYFNSASGSNIVMNNTCPEAGALGGGYGRDFWYDIFPNMLFYAIGDKYPDVEGVDMIMRTVAEQFYKADSIIMATKGDYRIREFDFVNMCIGNTEQMVQADAAAGIAYILYNAYHKYGDPRYLKAALSAMNSLNNETESQFYEVIMPFAVYMAARMNAEQSTNYDVAKFMDWTFDGESKSRPGWGVLTGEWDGYEVNGLCGSTSEGYGFAMNTFDLAWSLVPAVRYDQAYARAIAKWLVNAVSNSRYYYAPYVAPEHQALPYDKAIEMSKGVIAYEGFRVTDKYKTKRLEDVKGVAIGDGPDWMPTNPQESMLSIYGSAHVGIFGAIIRPTNVDKIIRIDCLVADVFVNKAYSTYAYYNPYAEQKSVEVIIDGAVDGELFDLYDIVSRTYLARNCTSGMIIVLSPDTAAVVVALPANSKIKQRDGKSYVNDVVIDYKG